MMNSLENGKEDYHLFQEQCDRQSQKANDTLALTYTLITLIFALVETNQNRGNCIAEVKK